MLSWSHSYAILQWQPQFSFPEGAQANEMIALRWLHIIFGIIWIGLLYFFNLVLTPAMKQCEPKLRIRIYPDLMSPAMGWFRSSAAVTVLVGLRYFTIHLSSDAAGWRPHPHRQVAGMVVFSLDGRVFLYLQAAASRQGNPE